ncbi:MAG TPA: hypothetical protein VNL14_00065 [Candidatus Acidoferrales bacterium]|nr:hypothetical protein [Candidatus Acidoferrales bacterium]
MALRLVRGIARETPEKPSRKSREEYMIACLSDEVADEKFTDWERGFVASVARQLARGGKLSDRQRQILERLWEK